MLSRIKIALHAIPWPTPVFKMDDWLDLVLEHYGIQETGGRKFPEFPLLIERYKKVLLSSQYMFSSNATGDCYIQRTDFPIPNKGLNYYAVAWYHNQLYELTKKINKKPVSIPVKELWEQSVKKKMKLIGPMFAL
jgi:hypothetical protein